MRILHRKIGRYQGAVIHGKDVVPPPSGDAAKLHAQRAFWLTGEVETGNRLGSVMMADGTAFTIGIDQHIAVYPRELADEDFNAEDDQGAAWDLLSTLEVTHSKYVEPLWGALLECGWYIGADGWLRWLENGRARVKNQGIDHVAGDLVHGALIREEFTPIDGVVRKDSEGWLECRVWGSLLHRLMRDPKTLDAQRMFGANHLEHRVKRRKLRLGSSRPTFQDAIYQGRPITEIESASMIPEFDLALCVFHSYTVNAPSVAFRLLEETIKATGFQCSTIKQQLAFSRDLLSRIKTKKYGRWDKRWGRTWEHALKIKWWDTSLFIGDNAVMPK